MKTQLIFFSDRVQSGIYGTSRGLAAFIVIVASMYLFLKKVGWSHLLLALAMCSAVAVQLPKKYQEVVTYNSLVTAVLLTVYFVDKQFSLKSMIKTTIVSFVTMILAGLASYQTGKYLNHY